MTGLPDSVPVDGSTIISYVPFTAHHHRAYRSVHGGSIILSARTCTPRIYHNIHGVQVFHLLWCDVIFHSLQQPSSPFVYFRFYTLSVRAYQASSSLYICCIYALKFGQYWTLFCIGNSSVSSTPYIQFLFVRPRFCLRLPSSSASQRTPLSLANSSYCQACSGLAPPSDYACRAHKNREAHPLQE